MVSFLGLTACEKGPAEKAGKQIDQAVKNTNDQIVETNKAIINEQTNTKPESPGDYFDDSAITGKIKAKLIADTQVAGAKIEVTTNQGVVILSGVVDSQVIADKALQIAESVTDVKRVENNLLVSPGN